jgi:hypothetical protein
MTFLPRTATVIEQMAVNRWQAVAWLGRKGITSWTMPAVSGLCGARMPLTTYAASRQRE